MKRGYPRSISLTCLLGFCFATPLQAVIVSGNTGINNGPPPPNTTFTPTTPVQPVNPNVPPAEAPAPRAAPTVTPNVSSAPISPVTPVSPVASPSTTPMQAVSKQIPPAQAAAIAQQFHEQMKANQVSAPLAAEPTTVVAQAQHARSVQSEHQLTASAVHAHALHQEAEEETLSPEELKSAQAFDALVHEVLPLSPDQIKKLHKYYDKTLAATATTPAPPPTPQFSSIHVNLDPGSTAPVIRLSAGFVTSLLFMDNSGEPWNIAAYSIGDPAAFNIQWDQKSNALFIQSMKQYSHGNLAVRLQQLDTPVMITLVSGQRQVDFRVDLQVPGRGPNAKAAVVETAINANVNPILLNILDGIPPIDSVKLGVIGGPGDAWLNDNKIYFRTRLTVLSPAWVATVASADGMHVYELMVTPYIMGSENGKTVNIKLTGL